MDNRYRITVTDRETGQVAEANGMAARCDTSFGLIIALGGHSDAGDAFYTSIVADHDRGVSRSELLHLMNAVFHTFSLFIRDDKDPSAVFALSVLSFTQYIENEVKEPLLRHALFSQLAQDAAKAWEAKQK